MAMLDRCGYKCEMVDNGAKAVDAIKAVASAYLQAKAQGSKYSQQCYDLILMDM